MKDIPKTVQETEQWYAQMLSEDGFLVIWTIQQLQIGEKITLITIKNLMQLPRSEQKFIITEETDLDTYIKINRKYFPNGNWSDFNERGYFYYKVTTD